MSGKIGMVRRADSTSIGRLPPPLLALGAIALWGTLAALGVALAHVPPFLLTGLALCVGGLLALPLSYFLLHIQKKLSKLVKQFLLI